MADVDDRTLRSEIESVINRHSAENGSNTPDFILADYLIACLAAFDAAVSRREQWYGRATGAPVHTPDEEPSEFVSCPSCKADVRPGETCECGERVNVASG